MELLFTYSFSPTFLKMIHSKTNGTYTEAVRNIEKEGDEHFLSKH